MPPEVFAERARFSRLETWSPAFLPVPAAPPADVFLELVRVAVPAGKYAFVDLVAALSLNPTTTIPLRIVPGVVWSAFIGDDKGGNPKPLPLDPNNGSAPWTYTDGTPIVRNLLVTPAKTLIFGATLTIASVPGTVAGLAAGIQGFLFDAESLSERDLIALTGTP